jgi:tetratricopeptide (TPR) repeat protein
MKRFLLVLICLSCIFLQGCESHFSISTENRSLSTMRSESDHATRFLVMGCDRAAHLADRLGCADAASRLAAAAKTDIGFDFPFRWESLSAFKWAAEKTGCWKFRYLTALVLASRGRDGEADAELEACAGDIDDVGALLFRAGRRDLKGALQDLEKARSLGDSWRVGLGFYHAYAVAGDWRSARSVLEDYVKRYPGKLGLELNYARALVKTGEWEKTVEFLDGIVTLPSELGEKPITIYQEALGLLAQRALKNGDEKAAKAYALKAIAYPETLGGGKPYRLDRLFESWPEEVANFCRREGLK